MDALPFRQIHLDFHTSGEIAEVGQDFDPEYFAQTLKRAHVNSVNVFARCWHGWMYYDSKKFAEDVHPGLVRRNLLAEQIEACHRHGIRAPIYVAVQVASQTAEKHPEWIQLSAEGKLGGRGPLEAGFKAPLCLNTPYADYLFAHVDELFDMLPAVDGFWFDGVSPQDCVCRRCREEMLQRGRDPADAWDRRAFGLEVCDRFTREMSQRVRARKADALLFYNAGHIGPRHRPVAGAFTHFEIESLPSGGWGYLHYPCVARYATGLQKQTIGMTGKFHTSWGDFHSFKNQAALEYEVFHMLATGAKCSVGDQLHPRGELCAHTYDLIGRVYAEVEAKEPWCNEARLCQNIGLLSAEELLPESFETMLPPATLGAVRMLQESARQFAVLDGSEDLNGFELLLIPEERRLDRELARKLEAYVAHGGRLIVCGTGALAEAADRFALDCLGLDYEGPAEYEPEFIVADAFPEAGLPPTEHVLYTRGTRVLPLTGTDVLARSARPYFNRSWRQYCSHRHAPVSGEAQSPAVTQNGRSIYFAHPLFSEYARTASRWCKQLINGAIDRLLPLDWLRHEGPSTVLATMTEQAALQRHVLHFLHYIPERRGQQFDTIEDVIPLHDLTVRFRNDRPVQSVRLVPEVRDLDFKVRDGVITFRIPEIRGHAMVEVAAKA